MRMRDVVDVVTSDPPPLRHSVEDIVASGERVRRRRRLVRLASGAAAVVVALGAAVTVAVPAFSERPERSGVTATGAAERTGVTPNAPAGPFTFTVAAYAVGRLRVAAPISVSTAYELAPVYADGLVSNDKAADPATEPPGRQKGDPGYVPDPNTPKNLSAYLTVYRSGAYDATKLAGATRVTVGGRPGLEVASTDGYWEMERTLAWQYADNAWAVILSRSEDVAYPSSDDLRQLAAGLRTDARTPARLPVKLAYLPAGYGLTEVGVHAYTGLSGIASARDGDLGGLLFSRPALPTTGLTGPFTGPEGANPAGSFVIFIGPAANSNQPDAKPGVTCLTGFCNRYFDGGRFQVQVSSEGLLPNSEMTRILEGITLTSPQDESAWTEVTRSLPS